jgi:hypothetical protein
MDKVYYRTENIGLAPRRTQLEIPGWAGDRQPRADNFHEQPWHCALFSEGAQYGIELFYPYANELIVAMEDGDLIFDGDFGPCPQPGLEWPPFRNFGGNYFTYQLLLDLKVPDRYALRIEPHPRFYTDRSGECPIAVQALIRRWWPMVFFCVFKSPLEGQRHVFRPCEPFAHLLVIPEEAPFELEEMSAADAAERELQARRIHANRDSLAGKTTWVSDTQTVFDGSYRHMLRAAKAMRKGE